MKKYSCISPLAFHYSEECIAPLIQPQSWLKVYRVLYNLPQIVVLNWEDCYSCQGMLRYQFGALHLEGACFYQDWSHCTHSENLLLEYSQKVCNGSCQQCSHLPSANLKLKQKCFLPRNFISFCLKFFDFIYYRILNLNWIYVIFKLLISK